MNTVGHYLCNNPLPAMPADSCKHHEPPQASIAPIYWRMKGERTTTQDMGAADWKAENGLVAVSTYNYDTHAVDWDESGLTVAELDADPDVERCNADGTPIAEPLTQTPGTSETSMVEPKPDEPLKVGDWVEILSIPQNVSGIKPGDTRQVDKIAKGSFRTLADNTAWWFACCMEGINFRRVPPPSEQAERASDQDRIAELERERDQAREQFSQVRRVLVESLNLTEVGNEFAPPCVYIDHATSLSQAAEVAIDTLKLSAEKHRLDAEEAKKALTTVQAEAAVMREAITSDITPRTARHSCLTKIRELSYGGGNAGDHFKKMLEKLESAIEGTAGRELLDEMKAKDDRIAELERHLAEQAPLVAIVRELRDMMLDDGGPSSTRNGTFFYDSDDRYCRLLTKLRDAKGGAI